jgi:DNA polymerase I-like protein with 3'-5' exonuclease and polymerase domains
MLLDQKAWRDNYDWASKLVEEDRLILDSYIRGPLRDKSLKLGILKNEDELVINWGSPKQRKVIFKYLYPDLEGVTKPFIKKYADANHVAELWEYLEGDFVPLNYLLLTEHNEFILEGGYLIPEGTVTINWDSPMQRLKLFQTVEPKLTSTSKEALASTTHPIIAAYTNYIDTAKLVTSYGEEYIDKYVDDDGYIRTNFNQILNTGRVSSSKPNMQQIPAKTSVGNRYRNCFITPKDWVYVSSDYNSQELVVIATISEDPVWMEALKNGEDLHSICADLVFGQKWRDGEDPDCRYRTHKQKCKCSKHKQMRTSVKTVNFGLAYGMSANKLALTVHITKQEAVSLITKYFTVFPKIKATLDKLAGFGMVHGYIITPQPFLRRRWFDKGPTDKQKVIEHLQGDYNPELGVIERASKNTPIQGGSGDMTKLALVYIRNYINDNKLRDTIKLSMQVHDQVDTICHKDYAKVWQDKMTTLMEDAAKVVIPSGLLKSETNITEKWEK